MRTPFVGGAAGSLLELLGRHGSEERTQEQMAPGLRGHREICGEVRTRRAAAAGSDAVVGNIAVPDRHLSVGQQEPIDGDKQTAEQPGGRRSERGGSGFGHRISLVFERAAGCRFKFRELM